MIIRPKQFAEELFSAISGANQKDADKITNQFVTALEKQNRLGMLDAIIKEYNKLLLKKNASPNVFIQSGQKVSKEIRNRVLNKMNIPEDVEVREEINPEMIGGMRIRYNDTLLDFSLKSKLTQLKQELLQ